MEVKELGHIVLYVRDIERSAEFYRDVGMYHFGLKVGDTDDELRAALAEVQSHDVKVVGASDHGVTHSLYIQDPEGNVLEIYCEMKDYDWRTQGMGFIARPLDLESIPAHTA